MEKRKLDCRTDIVRHLLRPISQSFSLEIITPNVSAVGVMAAVTPGILTDQHMHEFLRTVLRLLARNGHPLRHKYEKKRAAVKNS